ncbi:MAG: RDD family protein [Aridibacter sp.]
MSARAEKVIPAKKINNREVIVGFDAEKLKAPVLLRCGALLIDYILIVSVPVLSLLLGRYMGDDGAKLLNNQISNAGWLITFLLAVTNFLIFPMFSGQTIGKVMTGLRITTLEGKDPTLFSLFLRHFIGYPLTFLTGGLGFFVALFNAKGRALHDLISKTIVVYGRQTVKRTVIKTKLNKN